MEKENLKQDEQQAEELQDQPEAEQETAEEAEEMTPEEAMAKLAAAYHTLEQQKDALEGQMLRLQADFDNFRRRTRTEKEEWSQNITANFCGELLPVIDNFGRALDALKKSGMDEGHLTGVEMIARQLAELMQAKGVERIPTVGEDFDPKWHEAIAQLPVEDEAQNGKVTAEIQAGYRLGGKLLRVALVQVGIRQ